MKDKETKRFKKVYSQGTLSYIEIMVDTKTGVNYLFKSEGYAGGLTPLLGSDGKPIISNISDIENIEEVK